jgi:hypothetical protein
MTQSSRKATTFIQQSTFLSKEKGYSPLGRGNWARAVREQANNWRESCPRVQTITPAAASIADLAVKVQHSIQQSPELLEAVNDIVCTMAPKAGLGKGRSDGDDMATSGFPGGNSV